MEDVQIAVHDLFASSVTVMPKKGCIAHGCAEACLDAGYGVKDEANENRATRCGRACMTPGGMLLALNASKVHSLAKECKIVNVLLKPDATINQILVLLDGN